MPRLLGHVGVRLRRLDERVLGPPRPDAPDPLRTFGTNLILIGVVHTVAWLAGLPGAGPFLAVLVVPGVVLLVVARRRPRGST